MQVIKDDNRFGSFTVNNLFVSDYMAGLSGEAVKLYLYLCFLCENRLEAEQSAILTALHFTAPRLRNAAAELRSRGLIGAEEPNRKIFLTDLTALKISEKYGPAPLAAKSAPAAPNAALAEAIRAINITYFSGKMSIPWYNLIQRWQEDFDPAVFLLLFAHCEKYSDGRLNTRYVEKVAESWHAEGIRTEKDVAEKLERRERLNRFCEFMRRKTNRSAPYMDSDIEVMRKWLFTYQYGEEELSVLLERANISRPTIGFFDACVTEWHEKGLKNAGEIRAYEKERKKSAGSRPGEKAPASAASGSGSAPGSGRRSGEKNGIRGNFEQREYSDDFFASLVSPRPSDKGEKPAGTGEKPAGKKE